MNRELRLLMRLAVFVAAFSLVAYAPAAAAVSATDLSSKGIGSSETELGDLVADAIRAQVKADVGFITASELKETIIPKGDVSVEDLKNALTYRDDTISVLSLRGDQIRRALERSVMIYPQKNLGFLQVSGLEFTFDPKAPKEARALSVSVGGKPLRDSQSYTVAATNSLAKGALGYFRIWQDDQITRVTKTTVLKAVEDYLQANPKLNYKRNRINLAK